MMLGPFGLGTGVLMEIVLLKQRINLDFVNGEEMQKAKLDRMRALVRFLDPLVNCVIYCCYRGVKRPILWG